MPHIVKCSICGERFDRDKEPFVSTGNRRYAHQSCAIKIEGKENAAAREEIFRYTKELFKEHYSKIKIESSLNKMMQAGTYSYSGILKALKYWYDVKKGDISKSNYSLGIIPYIYRQAYDYYYAIWSARQNNADKDIEQFKPKTIVIKINNPTTSNRIKNKFSFLNEEDNQ